MAEAFDLIESDRDFAELVRRLRDAPRYAIDTEFHRERTYFPHVAVVQIADSHGVSLVDALEVDLNPFAEVLDGPGLAVMHAARQDMEVLSGLVTDDAEQLERAEELFRRIRDINQRYVEKGEEVRAKLAELLSEELSGEDVVSTAYEALRPKEPPPPGSDQRFV